MTPFRAAPSSGPRLAPAQPSDQAGGQSDPRAASAEGEGLPAWLTGRASLADTAPPLWGRTHVVEAALVFSAAPAVPGFGALAPEDAPAGLAMVFTPRGRQGPFDLARGGKPADLTGSLPPAAAASHGATRRSAALAPMGTPATLSIDDAHPPRTAFYDISARAVYLPSGEKLEAHSGLGGLMDQPHGMRIRMRGVTPPNVYRLRLRERLFHGVQAIRMLPEDEGAMFGRNGILAHTYMLGPSGQSNGCVSFKDYPRFLNAFLRGEVERLVVVAKLDRPPRFYNGREPLIARARPERKAGRRLAYSGGDTADGGSDERSAGAASFTSWLSSFRPGKPAATDR